MRASRNVVPDTFFGGKVECGTFCGGSIEPGTFHGATIEPGTFHGATIEPGTFHGEGMPANDSNVADDTARKDGSRRTSESAAGPKSSDTDEEVDAKRK